MSSSSIVPPPGPRWSLLAPTPNGPVEAGPIPVFSVLIPAYQAAETIGEALDSALGQTSPPHEVIVCDDGSTDDLDRALAPYRERIVLLRKENGGGASALNLAAHAATGEFVAVLDPDDKYAPGRLQALGELAAARPDLDILATDAYFERDGELVGRFNRRNPFPTIDQRRGILERCYLFNPAVRRARLLDLGGFDESLRTGYDWDSCIRLILAGARAGLVDEPLFHYRLREGSLTSERASSLRDRVTLLQRASRRSDLTAEERRTLALSIRSYERRALLVEAEQALRRGSPRTRRRLLALARAPGVGKRTRTKALAAAAAPRLARRVIERAPARSSDSRVAPSTSEAGRP